MSYEPDSQDKKEAYCRITKHLWTAWTYTATHKSRYCKRCELEVLLDKRQYKGVIMSDAEGNNIGYGEMTNEY